MLLIVAASKFGKARAAKEPKIPANLVIISVAQEEIRG
jgi:hypothetical protein